MMNLVEFLQLSIKRKKSVDNYFEFQKFQAKVLINDLKKYGINKAKRILDIGSGMGGYINEISTQFPDITVISLDKNLLSYAIKKNKGKNIETIEGDGTIIPLRDNTIDIVLASSVIEHIENQKALIDEAYRILKNKGVFYVSFPPFYSPVGGHSISPLHYLPGNMPFYLYSKLYKQKFTSFKNYGLVKTTIKNTKKLIKERFDILDIKPRIFNFIKPLLKIPLLNEIVCHHVEFFLCKKNKNP